MPSARLLLPTLLVLASLALACNRVAEPTQTDPDALPVAHVLDGPHDVAVLDMGELGTIRIELLPEIAPKSVAQFTRLTHNGFYDGTYFHRVLPGFMIQGGDPNTKNADPRDDGRGNAGSRVDDEFTDYPHLRGTLSMANTGYLDSSSSQFFIVHQDSRDLDGKYTAFGRVVSGIEVVDAIAALEIDEFGRYGPPNRPYPVNATIQRLTIEPAGGDSPEVENAGRDPGADTQEASPEAPAEAVAAADPTR